jgi:hypothetical protein
MNKLDLCKDLRTVVISGRLCCARLLQGGFRMLCAMPFTLACFIHGLHYEDRGPSLAIHSVDLTFRHSLYTSSESCSHQLSPRSVVPHCSILVITSLTSLVSQFAIQQTGKQATNQASKQQWPSTRPTTQPPSP